MFMFLIVLIAFLMFVLGFIVGSPKIDGKPIAWIFAVILIGLIGSMSFEFEEQHHQVIEYCIDNNVTLPNLYDGYIKDIKIERYKGSL